MEQQIFSDGIGRISVIGGVVRLDLVTYSATETDAKGQPRAVLSQRIVMGAEGFLRASEKILEAAQQMTRAAQPQPQLKTEPAPPQPAPPQPRTDPVPQPHAERAAPPPPKPAASPWSAPLVPKRPFP
jgi:hypothetical protein